MNVNDIDFQKDYYKILDIDRNASKDDIKKAFRKMSVKWHPDKHTDDPEDKKKEAEEKFKQINEAWSILSDDNLKSVYDAGPQTGFDMFMNPFAGGRKTPGEDVIVPLEVSLNDIVHGFTDKKIKYYRNVRCNKCHGSGGDSEMCPHCHGTGVITRTQSWGNKTMMTQTMCPHCGGTGKIIKKRCDECHGTGFKRQEEEYHLTVNPENLLNDNGALYVGPAGSEAKDPSAPNGSLIFLVVHKLPEGMTIKEIEYGKYSLINEIKLPYWDFILGKSVEVATPYGTKLSIKIPENWKEGQPLRARGKGLKSEYGTGDYIIIPTRNTTVYISDKEKHLLEEIRELHEK